MKIKSLCLTIFLLFICVTTAYAKEKTQKWPCGVVDFEKCATESKHGQSEQKMVEETEKKMKTLLEDKEKEITAIGTKLNDPELLDSLSPEAEEQLKIKYQTLTQEYGYYQNQLMQTLQQANMRSLRAIVDHVKKAAQTLSKEKNIPFIVQKEACFSFPPSADVTAFVVEKMDEDFDQQNKAKDKTLPKEVKAITTTENKN